MSIIKCHICKLNSITCGQVCIDTEDVKTLYKEGVSEQEILPKGFCTAHKCEYNHTGLHCTLEKCVLGLDELN